jgi:hypothetical protein
MYLEFEKSLAEIEGKIAELTKMNDDSRADLLLKNNECIPT